MRLALLFCLTLIMSACGSARPRNAPQALQCGLVRFEVTDTFEQLKQYRASQLHLFGLSDPNPSYNVLVLSAGGEYGAYGAGFLNGWRSIGDEALPGPREDIQIVTGVSTGAILATHAFLNEDATAEGEYRRLSGSRIFRKRLFFEYLWANSLLDTKGKDALIRAIIHDGVVEQVANQEGRFLHVGVVDMDSGRFMRIDMTKLAKTLPPALRGECYRAVIGASSAIPIAFAPTFVDGMMLVDGGARRHMFITEPPAQAKQPGIARRIYLLLHSDLDAGCVTTRNGVLDIASRTADLTTDQGFKDSIMHTRELAMTPISAGPLEGSPLFDVRYASAAAAAVACAPERDACRKSGGSLAEDGFCMPFMNCLADKGKEDGATYARAGTWLQFDPGSLSSKPACMAARASEDKLRGRTFFR